ncbi:acetyltransferase [Tsukamurella serpentis]
MTPIAIRSSGGVAEYSQLVRIWRSAVDATHTFLSAAHRDEIERELPGVYFPQARLRVAEVNGRPAGFAGTSNGDLAMLFVDASHHGSGVGSALLAHVIAEHGVRTVDVNEQNVTATDFYLRRGFRVAGRSETDGDGRPYPVLHLHLVP